MFSVFTSIYSHKAWNRVFDFGSFILNSDFNLWRETRWILILITSNGSLKTNFQLLKTSVEIFSRAKAASSEQVHRRVTRRAAAFGHLKSENAAHISTVVVVVVIMMLLLCACKKKGSHSRTQQCEIFYIVICQTAGPSGQRSITEVPKYNHGRGNGESGRWRSSIKFSL